MLTPKILWFEISEAFKSLVNSLNTHPDEIPEYIQSSDPNKILECIVANKYCYSTDAYIKVIPLTSKREEQTISKFSAYQQIFSEYPNLKPVLQNVYNTELFGHIVRKFPQCLVFTTMDEHQFVKTAHIISIKKFVELFLMNGHKDIFLQHLPEIESLSVLGQKSDKKTFVTIDLQNEDSLPLDVYSNFMGIVKSLGFKKFPVLVSVTNELFKTRVVENAFPNHQEIYGTFFRKPINDYVKIHFMF